MGGGAADALHRIVGPVVLDMGIGAGRLDRSLARAQRRGIDARRIAVADRGDQDAVRRRGQRPDRVVAQPLEIGRGGDPADGGGEIGEGRRVAPA
ncbi:hypothetical protein [Poseidonocella sp. HB161398]|uniref:hypothetical protein n=1 Tax=Poseidonocella sp. HB161398 TaxID=2320855 RepID=UPI00110817A9|nr:hypothetical protein [Poseidonocella sp. HB161398]